MQAAATARFISIVGHPLVVLPASAFGLAYSMGAPMARLSFIAGLSLVGLALLLWARANVRRGQWDHIDASHPRERGQWNAAVLMVLFVLVALCWAIDRPLAAGPLAALIVIACSIALSRWMKPSQHVAFAVLAAFVAGMASWLAGSVFAALALAVAWSRLVLKRHVTPEIVVGALVGGLAGATFLTVMSVLT